MTMFGIFDNVPGIDAKDSTANLGRHWGWLMAIGVLSIPLGIIALVLPVATTMGMTLALGAVFIVSGIMKLIQATKLRHDQGAMMRFTHSILSILTGVILFLMPGIGILGIAMMLCFYFFVGAAVQWAHASAMAPKNMQFWGHFSAICSFLLGVYIVITFPFSALSVPGVLFGIELLITGINLIAFSMAVRKRHQSKHMGDHHAPTSGLKHSGQYT